MTDMQVKYAQVLENERANRVAEAQKDVELQRKEKERLMQQHMNVVTAMEKGVKSSESIFKNMANGAKAAKDIFSIFGILGGL